MRKIIIIIFCFFTGCGYQPLYTGKNDNNFSFKEINLNGDKIINRKVLNLLPFKIDNKLSSNDELLIESKKTITETSKNSKGQTTTFKTTVELKLTIESKNIKIKERTFIKDFSYNNMDNKFDLAEKQREIEDNLINQIVEEIVMFINI